MVVTFDELVVLVVRNLQQRLVVAIEIVVYLVVVVIYRSQDMVVAVFVKVPLVGVTALIEGVLKVIVQHKVVLVDDHVDY